MSIEVCNVSKRFGDFEALKSVSLNIAAGELVALLGPSGSGKTTLLRIIAGLEFADGGRILLNNEDASDHSAGRRGVGFVFQHYALFRHMTVFDNIAFGLRVRPRADRPSKQDVRDKVMELLKLVQLEWVADRYPSQLSGGQRQRIALARALAVEPKVLLLDEPFGALDAKVRKELRRWLRRLHDEINIASVFVTHDQEEALEVADRVAIMNQGRLEQVGSPDEVYEHPANPFVYNFLGNVNLFHARLDSGRAHVDGVEFAAPEHASVSGPAVGYARPYELELHRATGCSDGIKAAVEDVYGVGPIVSVEVRRCDNGELLHAEISRKRCRELDLKSGDKVCVTPKNVRVFIEDYCI